MIKERLKKIEFLVTYYRKIAAYNPIKYYKKITRYNPLNMQWCRVVMDRETEKIVSNLPMADLDALEISGEKWKSKGFKSYCTKSFPEYDVCSSILEEKFDVIIAEQVFEHLLWPYRAGQNIFAMLNNGGYLLITTPFLIKIHNYPVDCTRWTNTGMKYFLAECGFDLDEITVGSWGNRECVVANFDEWKPYNPIKHSLTNEQDFPLVVWALAKKKVL